MKSSTCQCAAACPSPVVRVIAGDGYCVQHFHQTIWPIMRNVARRGGVNSRTGDTMYPVIPAHMPIGIGRFVYFRGTNPNDAMLRCDECSRTWIGDWLGEWCDGCVRRGVLWA